MGTGESLILRKLESSNFDDFVKIFKDDGSGCYCASWRSMDATWSARCKDPTKPNLTITRQNVDHGHHIGFLVYEGSALIGWAGAGPKTEFPSMEKDRYGARLSPFATDTWAIGCLAMETDLGDGRDGFSEIVIAITKAAKAAKAKVLEAYPVRPWDKARAYRGSEDLYARLGFDIRNSESDGGSQILLMSLDLPCEG